MARKNTRKRPQSFSRNDLLLAGLASLLLIGLLGGVIYAGNKNTAVNEHELYCSLEGAERHLIVLFDRSTPLTPSQSNIIAETLLKEAEQLNSGSRLSVFEIDPNQMGGLSEPIFSGCKPRSGAEADPLTENATMIEREYQENYVAPLNRVSDTYIYPRSEDLRQSPILEAFLDLANITSNRSEYANNSIILFSDLIQHSDTTSFYGRPVSFDNWLSLPGNRMLVPAIFGEIKVYLLLREEDNLLALQEQLFANFWVQYLTSSRLIQNGFEKVR